MRVGLLLLVFFLAACGGEPTGSPASGWRHCTLEGVRNGSGLAVHAGQLLVVCGDDDRGVYAVPIDALAPGEPVRVRALEMVRNDDAYLMGADALATQDFRLRHLWPLSMDFQGIAVQPPNFVFLGDRVRRVVYWGRLTTDAAGRASRVDLSGCFVVPGAQRTQAEAGDWRDKGPGLAGLAAVAESGKTEDVYAVDHLPGEDGVLRVQRMNRYGSSLGAFRLTAGAASGSRFGGLERRRGGFLLLGADGGGVLSVAEPRRGAAATLSDPVARPDIAGVAQWRGLARGVDGTLYLLSDGEPAVLAWRPAAGARNE